MSEFHNKNWHGALVLSSLRDALAFDCGSIERSRDAHRYTQEPHSRKACGIATLRAQYLVEKYGALIIILIPHLPHLPHLSSPQSPVQID
ncbi:hypothetical protein H1Q63_33935 [Desmonostoc muscorum CCALA 125]|nr:hypothetical protein [Desmonostoc muscorum CCALA 125]